MSHTAKVNQASTSYHNRTEPRKPREAVLNLLYADGCVETYAERYVDVHFAVMPYMTTAEGRIAGEGYLNATLPHRYRSLYWPGNLRAADMVRMVRPSEIARRDWNLEFLNAITEAGKILRGETEMEGRQIWIA